MHISRSRCSPRKINLTPLIDVIFLLIVFFLFTSKFNIVDAINMDVSTGEGDNTTQAEHPSILVSLTRSGYFTVGKKEYPISQLAHQLRGKLERDSNQEIIIASSKNIHVQDVIQAMDYVKTVGGNHILLIDEEVGK